LSGPNITVHVHTHHTACTHPTPTHTHTLYTPHIHHTNAHTHPPHSHIHTHHTAHTHIPTHTPTHTGTHKTHTHAHTPTAQQPITTSFAPWRGWELAARNIFDTKTKSKWEGGISHSHPRPSSLPSPLSVWRGSSFTRMLPSQCRSVGIFLSRCCGQQPASVLEFTLS